MAEPLVDIWTIHLADPGGGIELCRSLLSSDEVQRADRFHFERDRRRFIMAHAAMRQILSRYTNLAPRQLAFSYGARGKPELSGELGNAGIRFNLSHSGEVALLAVTQGLTVGVDIELVDSQFAGEEIAARFFSAREVRCLQALPAAERAESFFACWTRKEAYIKALGEGLSVPLNCFEVAFGPGVPAALLEVRVDPGEAARWSMYDIDAGEGYRAALVVEGKKHRLRRLQWVSSPELNAPGP